MLAFMLQPLPQGRMGAKARPSTLEAFPPCTWASIVLLPCTHGHREHVGHKVLIQGRRTQPNSPRAAPHLANGVTAPLLSVGLMSRLGKANKVARSHNGSCGSSAAARLDQKHVHGGKSSRERCQGLL